MYNSNSWNFALEYFVYNGALAQKNFSNSVKDIPGQNLFFVLLSTIMEKILTQAKNLFSFNGNNPSSAQLKFNRIYVTLVNCIPSYQRPFFSLTLKKNLKKIINNFFAMNIILFGKFSPKGKIWGKT